MRGLDFSRAYRKLEERMKIQAEADGDVFLPSPEPEAPAQYVLICMEPSLGRWARSAQEARAKVRAGFRNFLSSMEDFIVHFCARHYLCGPAQRYHITDVSKGAMLVSRARAQRGERYDRWYDLLLDELDLVATRDAVMVAVGRAVAQFLERKGFARPLRCVIHYSGQAARARACGVIGQEDRFETFRGSVSLEDLVTTAEQVLKSAHVPSEMRDETLSRLRRGKLTIPRERLIFNYKLAFESVRSCGSVLQPAWARTSLPD